MAQFRVSMVTVGRGPVEQRKLRAAELGQSNRREKRKVGNGYGRDLYAAVHAARESRYVR